ncbi:MAG: HD domain-containing phosphohydrolase [Halanaerobiales bacterium]
MKERKRCIKNFSLYEVLKMFSGALDLISRELVGHHRQVAYISYMIGKEMEMTESKLRKLVISALIHDIGIFYLNQSISDLCFDSRDDFHAEVGYQLIKSHFPLEDIPDIIRYHHREWSERNANIVEDDISELANVLFLADRIASLIDTRDILNKKEFILGKIEERESTDFWPEAVRAFKKLAVREYFWLDTVNSWQMRQFLDGNSKIYDDNLSINDLLKFSEILSYIIDFRSSFTATHSHGVAVLAEMMGCYFGFDQEGCKMLKIAGFVHDIGKLAVPLKILNKPAALTNEEWNIMKSHSYHTFCVLDESKELDLIKEWASYHHERLRGDGYPFHLKEDRLSIGSRVMSVVDVFTGITENRPYRAGMTQNQVNVILNEMTENHILDQEVVRILLENYRIFDSLRLESQKKARKYYKDFKDLIDEKREEWNFNKKTKGI